MLAFLLGVRVNDSSTYYYPDNRKYIRYPWEKRSYFDDFDKLKQIDEEDRSTVRQKLSKETGYTGISALLRLWYLTGFDVCLDTVFDEMHNIAMNVDKKFLDYLVSSGKLNEKEVDERLKSVNFSHGKF